MNKLALLGSILVFLAKAVSYRWVLYLIELIRRFLRQLRDHWKSFGTEHSASELPPKDCTVVDNPSFHKPDPCIYSQQYLTSLGLAVTWDNPDIVLRRNGVVVPEYDLLPDTDYQIEATVWNNSYDAPAMGVRVAFSFLSFGVGTVSTAIGTIFVNLGVKGGVNHPALAVMPWRTPAVAGHFCIQVLLTWLDDANPGNNLGQNNVDVVAAHSPATFTFQLRNDTGRPNRFRFAVDTYALPQSPACPVRIPATDRGPLSTRLPAIRARHDPKAHPVPAAWTVDVSPAEPELAPGAETTVAVTVTPPAGFTGRTPFNVNAYAGTRFAGGVSVTVEKV
jgi:hypothetical protein